MDVTSNLLTARQAEKVNLAKYKMKILKRKVEYLENELALHEQNHTPLTDEFCILMDKFPLDIDESLITVTPE